MNEIQIHDFDIEQLRARLRKMTDDQLREFGKAYAVRGYAVGESREAAEGRVCDAVKGMSGGVAEEISGRFSGTRVAGHDAQHRDLTGAPRKANRAESPSIADSPLPETCSALGR